MLFRRRTARRFWVRWGLTGARCAPSETLGSRLAVDHPDLAFGSVHSTVVVDQHITLSTSPRSSHHFLLLSSHSSSISPACFFKGISFPPPFSFFDFPPTIFVPCTISSFPSFPFSPAPGGRRRSRPKSVGTAPLPRETPADRLLQRTSRSCDPSCAHLLVVGVHAVRVQSGRPRLRRCPS